MKVTRDAEAWAMMVSHGAPGWMDTILPRVEWRDARTLPWYLRWLDRW